MNEFGDEIVPFSAGEETAPLIAGEKPAAPQGINEFGDETVAFQAPEPAEKASKLNMLGGLKDVGKLAYDIPAQTMGAVGGLMEDPDPRDRDTIADTWREGAQERTAQRKGELTPEQREEAILPFKLPFMERKLTRGDIADTSSSTGFSLVSGLSGAAALPIAALPVPGARPAAVATGMGLSGTASYRMDRANTTEELFKHTEKARGGAILTKQERSALLALNKDDIAMHALMEAGPEAAGNMLGVIPGVKSIFKGVAKGKLKKVALGLVRLYSTEFATETVTQMGQQRAESRMGMTPEAERKWSDPKAWGDSFQEVAPSVAILSTLMGGGGAIAGKVVGNKDVEPKEFDTKRATQFVDVLSKEQPTPETAEMIQTVLRDPRTTTEARQQIIDSGILAQHGVPLPTDTKQAAAGSPMDLVNQQGETEAVTETGLGSPLVIGADQTGAPQAEYSPFSEEEAQFREDELMNQFAEGGEAQTARQDILADAETGQSVRTKMLNNEPLTEQEEVYRDAHLEEVKEQRKLQAAADKKAVADQKKRKEFLESIGKDVAEADALNDVINNGEVKDEVVEQPDIAEEPKVEFEPARKEAEEVAQADPHRQAMEEAKRMGGISVEQAKEMFSPDTVKELSKVGLFTKSGGQIDDMSSQLGYESTNDLVNAWSDTALKKDDIARFEAEQQAEFDMAEDAQRIAPVTEQSVEDFKILTDRMTADSGYMTAAEITESNSLSVAQKAELLDIQATTKQEKKVEEKVTETPEAEAQAEKTGTEETAERGGSRLTDGGVRDEPVEVEKDETKKETNLPNTDEKVSEEVQAEHEEITYDKKAARFHGLTDRTRAKLLRDAKNAGIKYKIGQKGLTKDKIISDILIKLDEGDVTTAEEKPVPKEDRVADTFEGAPVEPSPEASEAEWDAYDKAVDDLFGAPLFSIANKEIPAEVQDGDNSVNVAEASQSVYKSGMTIAQFVKGMRKALGKAYSKVRKYIRDIFADIVAFNKGLGEVGAITVRRGVKEVTTSTGKPFKSELSATTGIRRQGVEGYGIVAREGGFVGVPIDSVDGKTLDEVLPKTQTQAEKLGLTQTEFIGNLENVKKYFPEHYASFQSAIANMDRTDSDRLLRSLKANKSTAWAVSAIRAGVVRDVFNKALNGEDISTISTGNFWSAEGKVDLRDTKMIKRFTQGEGAVISFGSRYEFMGGNRKAETDFSGSFLNCDPSEVCAANCYSARGQGGVTAQVLKAEFTEYIANKHPDILIEHLSDYSSSPAGMAGLALRMNEKGDLSEAQIELSNKLKDKGIRLQIFSKRPELLRKVSSFHWRSLSIDASNTQVALDNPDLSLAVVVTDDFSDDFMMQVKDRVNVTFPINLKNKTWSVQELKNILPMSYNEIKNTICPVEIGKKITIEGADFVSIQRNLDNLASRGAWTCTSCDKWGVAGCFFGKNKSSRVRKATNLHNENVAGDDNGAAFIINEVEAALGLLKDKGTINGQQLERLLEDFRGAVQSSSERVDTEAAEADSHEIDRESGKDEEGLRDGQEDVRLSQANTTSQTNTTTQVSKEIKQFLGKGFDRMLKNDKLEVVQSVDKLPKSISGFFKMVAWHGTPHDVDKFSSDKIGTGEGAQAYGYGLYFASSRDVAEYYKNALSDTGIKLPNGEKVMASQMVTGSPYAILLNIMSESGSHFTKIDRLSKRAKHLSDRISDKDTGMYVGGELKKELKSVNKAIEYLATGDVEIISGNLYQVELAPKEAEYLLWDDVTPSQTKKAVQAGLKKHKADFLKSRKEHYLANEDKYNWGNDTAKYPAMVKVFLEESESNFDRKANDILDGFGGKDGRALYKNLSRLLKSDKAASEFLHSLGIRGIKYADGATRNKQGDQDFNYVIFNDADIEITALYSKNGNIAGAYDPKTGKTWLVADNIKKTDAKYVALHEISHALLREDKQFMKNRGDILGKFKSSKLFNKYADRVPEDTGLRTGETYDTLSKERKLAVDDIRLEESLTYFIQDKANHKTGLFRRIVASVKAAMYRAGIKVNLTDADVVALFTQGARSFAKKQGAEKTETVGEAVAAFSKQFGISVKEAQKQYDAVVSKFKGTDGWLKAPNGKATRLNERQWVQVQTPAFKSWFDDSAVVDRNGEPKIVYHGTNKDIKRFDINKAGSSGVPKTGKSKVIYFTDEKFESNFYANAATDWPAFYDAIDKGKSTMKAMQAARLGKNVIPVFLKIKSPITDDANGIVTTNRDRVKKLLGNQAVNDGFIIENTRSVSTDDPLSTNYIVWNPNQIKSATGNTGQFSPNTDDIRFSRIKHMPKKYLEAIKSVTNTAKFKSWFGNSKVTSNGQPHILYHGTSHPQFLSDKDYPWVFDTDRAVNQASSPLAGLGVFLGNDTISNAHSVGTPGTTHPFFVRIEKPLVMTADELEAKVNNVDSAKAFRKRSMELGGYDGIIISDRGQVIAFEANQLKSASENTGEFSRNDDDVRYSMATVEKINETIRKASKKPVRPETEQKLLDEYAKLDEAMTNPSKSVSAKIAFLTLFARHPSVPALSKAKLPRLMRDIANAKRIETQEKRLGQALVYLQNDISKQYRSSIIKTIKRVAGQVKEGTFPRAMLSPELQDDLNTIRIAVRMKDTPAFDEANPVKSELQQAFSGLQNKTLEELSGLAEQVKQVKETGKLNVREVKTAWNDRTAEVTEWLNKEITGQDKPISETGAQAAARRRKEKSVRGQVRALAGVVENSIISWEFILDKIATKAGKKTLQSRAVTELAGVAQNAKRNSESFDRESMETFTDAAERIFKVTAGKGLKKALGITNKLTKKLSEYSKKPVEISTDGGMYKLTPVEAAYYIQVRKDIASAPIFKKMGFTKETWVELEAMITPEFKQWTDYLNDEFLAESNEAENLSYVAINGVSQKNKGLDWYREGQTEIPAMSLHDAVLNRVLNANHARAWNAPSKMFNDIFSNETTRGFIEQHHGKSTLNVLDSFLEDFSKSPSELRGDMRVLDKLRANVVTAMIGANPTTFFKQLTSIPAYAADIPTADFIKNFAYGASHPDQVLRMMRSSGMVADRFGKGYERDVRDIARTTSEQMVGGVKSVKDMLMVATKVGDGMALMGGFTVYKYHYDKAIRDGGGVEHAKKVAMDKFEAATERTQQASGTAALGWVQRKNSITKLFTMYMTAPASYTRNTMAAVRGMKTDPLGSSKRLLLFNVMLPMLFQAVASGFVGVGGEDEDEWNNFWKKELRAVAMGPFLGLPIARDIATSLWDSMMGEHYGPNFSLSPATESISSLTKSVLNASKGVKTGEHKFYDKAGNDFADFLGYMSGLPTKPMRRLLEGWEDLAGDETERPLLAATGYSRAARNERRESVPLPKGQRSLINRLKKQARLATSRGHTDRADALNKRIAEIKNHYYHNI